MISIMRQLKGNKIKAYAVLFWIFVWELVSRYLNQEILLVSPFSVVKRLWELMREGSFYLSLFHSISRILLGFLLAELFAMLCSLGASKSRLLRDILEPMIFTIRAIPVASFIILILVWVPSRRLSTSICFLMAFPILYEAFSVGIRECDGKLLEMARVFRISGVERLRTIWLPALLPYFKAASTTALGLCWKAGIAAEVIGLPGSSIGEMLYNAKVYLDTPDLFAWTLVIVLLSVGFQRLLEWMLQRRMEWMRRER